MIKTYKYRIYPTNSQETTLENIFSMCRHLYNWSLNERIEAYQDEQKSVSYYDQSAGLPLLKDERPWFSSVYAQTLQDVLKRVDKAFKNFFRRAKDKSIKAKGFPKFKKKGQWNSITYPQWNKHPSGDSVKVPKVGEMKIILHRMIPGDAKIKTMTVSKESDKWFACFSFEIESHVEPKQDLSDCVGIDLGLIDFYHTSDGQSVKVPQFLRKKLKDLKKIQRKFSKVAKGSTVWLKILKVLRKIHFRVKCRRMDFLHKIANNLLKHDLIVHENLNIQSMMKTGWKGLNLSIGDVGWYTFIQILTYKASSLGKRVVGVDPRMTSQTCSSCGEIVKKSLSERTHQCGSCGFVANRDHNAALNILRLGLESLGISLEAPTIALA